MYTEAGSILLRMASAHTAGGKSSKHPMPGFVPLLSPWVPFFRSPPDPPKKACLSSTPKQFYYSDAEVHQGKATWDTDDLCSPGSRHPCVSAGM